MCQEYKRREEKHQVCHGMHLFLPAAYTDIYIFLKKKDEKGNEMNKLKCAKIDKYHQSSTRGDTRSTEQWRSKKNHFSFIHYVHVLTPLTLILLFIFKKVNYKLYKQL